MRNLDVDNMNNLDESFSNLFGSDLKIKDLFSKEAIKGGLLYGPIGAVTEANKKLKKAQTALNEANSAEKEVAKAELEMANQALLEANRQLEEAKSSGKSGDNSNGDSNSGNNPSEERTSMNPAVKWSLIGGGILVVLVGGFFAIRYFKKK